ncbi:MAG: hypothetical protein OSB68_10215 [Dehalococcoidia bacterium]|nr:hypothetical protein [Dehalococcoidia bacterium]
MATAPSELIEPLLDIEKAAEQDRAKIPVHATVGAFFTTSRALIICSKRFILYPVLTSQYRD